MKIVALTILVGFLYAGCDLASTVPPLVIRNDYESQTYRFTNTSDKPIHGISITEGKDTAIMIDTIEPHKTEAVSWSLLTWVKSDATVTCVDHSKPIKLNPSQ